jgi:hypothetical protein
MGRGKGRDKSQVSSLEVTRETILRLKMLKKDFRKINKKQFKNVDDVINHLINFMEKRSGTSNKI